MPQLDGTTKYSPKTYATEYDVNSVLKEPNFVFTPEGEILYAYTKIMVFRNSKLEFSSSIKLYSLESVILRKEEQNVIKPKVSRPLTDDTSTTLN